MCGEHVKIKCFNHCIASLLGETPIVFDYFMMIIEPKQAGLVADWYSWGRVDPVISV